MERKERMKAIWVAEQHVPTSTDCRFCDIDVFGNAEFTKRSLLRE